MSKLTEIDDASFDQTVIQSETPTLVDFGAVWCRPCMMLTPALEEIAAEYAGKLNIVKMDADKNLKTVSKFGVMSLPTVIIFKGGQPATQFVGYKSKQDIKKIIDEVIG
jgi:thioredoxin 1